MRVSVFRAATLTAVAAFLLIGSVAPSAQSVDDIVANHIAARGGYDKIKAIETIKITRTVATQFSSVAVVMYKKRPALLRIEQTPKGQPAAIPRGINADGAWDMVQGKLTMRPPKVAAEAQQIDADFDGLLVDWKQKGHRVELVGTEPFGGSTAHRLRVTTQGGYVRDIFIDTKSYMETGMTGKVLLPAMDPKTGEPRTQDSTFIYSDFRDVNGVKFPFNIDEDRTAGPITQSFAIYTDKIEVNVPMEDALFAAPAAK